MKCAIALSIAMLIALFLVPPINHAGAHADVPRFKAADCPVEIPDDPPIDCGYLVVPADYGDPASDTFRLPVIIIHSRSPDPAPDPYLYTSGGPGYSSLGEVWGLARSDIVDSRDVIILEQRGNLYAEPSLTCDTSVLWQEREGDTACLDSLLARGIDLTDYTTQAIAADINALRQVLDYEEWNLSGASYSTQLMLLTLHRYPEGIRSVVLQSASLLTESRYEHDPEHAVRALEVMFKDCAADPACASAYPDLEGRFYDLFHRLNAEPVSFEIRDTSWGEPITMTVSGKDLLGWMVTDAFYGPARPPYRTAYLPLLIDLVEKGDTDLLYPWARDQLRGLSGDSRWARGLYYAVSCQNDAPAVTAEEMATQASAYPELDGYVRHARELEICALWDLPPAPPLATAPVRSDIPTLILAGAYDPITPPEWGQAAAEGLENSYYYEFPSAGHSVNTDNDCLQEILTAFLKDPTSAPDASCLTSMPGPGFVQEQDLIFVPSFYEYYWGDIGYNRIQHSLYQACENAFLLAILLLLVLGVAWAIRLRRHRTPPDRKALLAFSFAGLVSVLYYSFSQVMRAVSRAVAASEPMAFHFGLPAEYGPLFVIPLALALLTAVLVAIAVLAWVRGTWSVLARALFTLLILPTIGFTALLGWWGWLAVFF
jgi:pimeloyl-ACP methyl ester carboxylesterase